MEPEVVVTGIGYFGHVMWGLAAIGSVMGMKIAGTTMAAVWASECKDDDGMPTMGYLAYTFLPASQALYPLIVHMMRPEMYSQGWIGLSVGLSTGLILCAAAYAQGVACAASIRSAHESNGKLFGPGFVVPGTIEGIGLVVVGIITFMATVV